MLSHSGSSSALKAVLLTQVWEPESQDQVLQVAPFAPHRPSPLGQGQMSNPQVRQAMIDEMAVVKDRMTAVRGHVYYDINHSLKPAVARLMLQGLRLEDHDAQVLPSVRTVAQLLKVRHVGSPVCYQASCTHAERCRLFFSFLS